MIIPVNPTANKKLIIMESFLPESEMLDVPKKPVRAILTVTADDSNRTNIIFCPLPNLFF